MWCQKYFLLSWTLAPFLTKRSKPTSFASLMRKSVLKNTQRAGLLVNRCCQNNAVYQHVQASTIRSADNAKSTSFRSLKLYRPTKHSSPIVQKTTVKSLDERKTETKQYCKKYPFKMKNVDSNFAVCGNVEHLLVYEPLPQTSFFLHCIFPPV